MRSTFQVRMTCGCRGLSMIATRSQTSSFYPYSSHSSRCEVGSSEVILLAVEGYNAAESYKQEALWRPGVLGSLSLRSPCSAAGGDCGTERRTLLIPFLVVSFVNFVESVIRLDAHR